MSARSTENARRSTTTVAMTFANRHYDPELIELVHAWDIDGIEENPTGYEDTKQEALAAMGGDLLRWVTVEVKVPDAGIRDALYGSPPSIESSEPVITSRFRPAAQSEQDGEKKSRSEVTGAPRAGSYGHEGEEQHQGQAQRLPGLQEGERDEGDREPRHGDDGVPVLRVGEHHGALTDSRFRPGEDQS